MGTNLQQPLHYIEQIVNINILIEIMRDKNLSNDEKARYLFSTLQFVKWAYCGMASYLLRELNNGELDKESDKRFKTVQKYIDEILRDYAPIYHGDTLEYPDLTDVEEKLKEIKNII